MGSPDTQTRRLRTGCLIASAGIAAFVAFCAARVDLTPHVRAYQIFYAIACAGFVSLVWIVQRPDCERILGNWVWWLGACVALRVALFHAVPSDDTYRYVWEGRIQAHGFNPYIHAPDAPQLAHLRGDAWASINHPDYATIYPPLAQLVFRGIARLSPSIYAANAVFLLLDVATVILLGRWAAIRGHPPHRALSYALCPLVLAAFALEGHLDSLMLLLLAGAGLAIERDRLYLAAVLLAGAIAAKLVAIVLLGWLAVRSWRAALLCLTCAAATCWPYASAGTDLVSSLVRFAGESQVLGLLYPVFGKLLGATGGRVASVLLLLGVALWSIRRQDDFCTYAAVVIGSLILVSPIVHFWYLSWVLLFVALRPRWCWIVLAASMVFYVEARQVGYRTGTWSMPSWVTFAFYAPFVLAWIVELAGQMTARRRTQDAPP